MAWSGTAYYGETSNQNSNTIDVDLTFGSTVTPQTGDRIGIVAAGVARRVGSPMSPAGVSISQAGYSEEVENTYEENVSTVYIASQVAVYSDTFTTGDDTTPTITFSWSSPGSRSICVSWFLVRGEDGAGTVTTVSGDGAIDFNPPSATTGAGNQDLLVIVLGGAAGKSGPTGHSSGPTSYTVDAIAQANGGDTDAGSLSAYRTIDSSTTEDPGSVTWTTGASNYGECYAAATFLFYTTAAAPQDVDLPFLQPVTLYAPTVETNIELPFLEPVTLYPPTLRFQYQVDLPFLEPVTLYPPELRREERINLPFLEPVTLYPIKIATRIDLPFLQPVTLYPPEVRREERAELPFLEPVTLYPVKIQREERINLPFLEPVTLYPPTVQYQFQIFLPFLEPVTLYPPTVEAGDVNLPFLQPVTLYAPTVVGAQRIFEFADSNVLTIDMGASNKVEVYADSTITSSGVDESLQATTGLTSGWNHVTITKDGNVFTIFVAGVEAGTGTVGISGAAAITEDFRISDSQAGWQGRAAEIALWQQVLTDAQIAILAAASLDAFPQETAGTRIGNLLSNVNFPSGSAWRDLDTEGFVLEAITDTDNTALAIVQQAELSEGGIFYQAPSGQVVFHNRTALQADQTITGTYRDDGTDYRDLVVAYSEQGLYNRARITVASGIVYSADNTNTDDFGIRAIERTVDLQDRDGQTYAEWLANRTGGFNLRVSQLRINPHTDTTTLFPLILSTDLFQRIEVKRFYSNAEPIESLNLVIEGITISWHPGNWDHIWRTGVVGYGAWTLGTSTLGTNTYLTS